MKPKIVLDYLLAISLLLLLLLPTIVILFLVFKEDFNNPIYSSIRVKKNSKKFSLFKIRSMKVSNQINKVKSTSFDDPRISKIGKFIRKYKIDEIPQLLNILKNDMSFVGPRPNVIEEVSLYSNEENKLLDVKPGITDFASIIFSDEADILKDSKNPNLDYNLLIRPWKSLIGLYYVEKNNFIMDLEILTLTAISLFNKKLSTRYISKKLLSHDFNTYKLLFNPDRNLTPIAPPGHSNLVTQKDLDTVYYN